MSNSDRAAAAAFIIVCAVIAVMLFLNLGCSPETPC